MSELSQTVIFGVIIGSFYGLLGCGFGLIFGVTGRFHFAYATTFVVSAFVSVVLVTETGLPLYLGVAVGLLAGIASGVLMEWFLYRPLVAKSPETALLGVFVTSLGVVILGENLISLVWGSESRPLSPGFTPKQISLTDGISFTTLDLMTVLTCGTLIVVLAVCLRRSQFGRAIRGVQENTDMAVAVGISPRFVYVIVFAIGSLLASVAAVLYTMRGAIAPGAGLQPTFTALVVVFLAGVRSSPLRFGVVGVIVGVIEALARNYIAIQWSQAVVFGILFLYIAATPYLAGRRIRLPLRRARAAASA